MNEIFTNKNKVFFPHLDGLRFFAFLAVFLSHAFLFLGYSSSSKLYTLARHLCVHGDLGVRFFFVLSGFLITYLLYTEINIHGSIRVKHFYLRRVFRIWPLYILILCIGFFIVPNIPFLAEKEFMFDFPIKAPLERLPAYALFLANFDLIHHKNTSFILAVLWSVSIEEQFYLLWPLLLNGLKNKKINIVFLGLIFLSFIYRVFYWDSPPELAFSTFSAISDLCVGALAAYSIQYNPRFKEKLRLLKKQQILIIYFFGFLMFPLRGFSHIWGDHFFRFYIPFEPLLFSVFFAFIVLEQNFSVNSLFKTGKFPVFSFLGKISYGLYCFHMVAITLCLSVFMHFGLYSNQLPNFLFLALSSFGLSIVLASISYVVIEKRLITFKEKYSRFPKQKYEATT